MSGILAEARRQVLHEGRGLDEGQRGGINAITVGNCLTTLGRPARADWTCSPG